MDAIKLCMGKGGFGGWLHIPVTCACEWTIRSNYDEWGPSFQASNRRSLLRPCLGWKGNDACWNRFMEACIRKRFICARRKKLSVVSHTSKLPPTSQTSTVCMRAQTCDEYAWLQNVSRGYVWRHIENSLVYICACARHDSSEIDNLVKRKQCLRLNR